MAERRRILVAGGGAAGFFAAIECAAADPLADISIHEATAHPLAKVRVSGGGRCNVTHACYDPRELAGNFPRGSRELIGPFSRFGPTGRNSDRGQILYGHVLPGHTTVERPAGP